MQEGLIQSLKSNTHSYYIPFHLLSKLQCRSSSLLTEDLHLHSLSIVRRRQRRRSSMALNNNARVSAQRLLRTAASFAASAMLVRTIVNDFLPAEVRDYVFSNFANFCTALSSQVTIVIAEKEGVSTNDLFSAAMTYLGTRITPSTRRLRASSPDGDKNFIFAMEPGEEMTDIFEGIPFKWLLVSKQLTGRVRFVGQYVSTDKSFSLELSFDKRYKDRALSTYLQHIVDQSKAIKAEQKSLKLYTNNHGGWASVQLHLPATFDTLAMDPELKLAVMDDLKRFVRRREHYRRIGKAWKRGYLLYGPPGTGKSSLIAAMANFLRFNIYDLELMQVESNSHLRSLLIETENRSIIVIEDIDCSAEFPVQQPQQQMFCRMVARRGGRIAGQRGGRVRIFRESRPLLNDKVTLSGLLNFVDGLWSSCGDERIIVFTTNYRERLDPALLRAGRMDMHIHMSYCRPAAFRILASNYHAVDEHPFFGEIERLLEEVEVTPAAIAEELLRSDDVDAALGGLVRFLQGRKEEASKAKVNAEIGVVQVVEDLGIGGKKEQDK